MKKAWLWLALSIGVGVAVPLVVDFRWFYDAGRAVIAGHTPYQVDGFYNPVYVAVAYVLFAWLPFEVAYRLHAGLALFVYGAALWRLNGRRLDSFLLALFGPFVFMCVLYGSLDWWIFLGAIMPPSVGLWLVLAKPQIGIGVAAVMLVDEYRQHGLKRVLILTAPIVLAYAISISLGLWRTTPIQQSWNMSAWPMGVVAGAWLIWRALRQSDRALAMAAATLASPYLAIVSWIGMVPALARSRRWAVIGIIAGWAIFISWRVRI